MFKSVKYRESINFCADQPVINVSYSSETMVIIERSWRAFGGMASVMLLNADSDEEFWEETANYAVIIFN